MSEREIFNTWVKCYGMGVNEQLASWLSWQARASLAGWRDIASAPMTGEKILVTWPDKNQAVVFWNESRKAFSASDGGWGTDRYRLEDENYPTHWMPLPEPPTTENP